MHRKIITLKKPPIPSDKNKESTPTIVKPLKIEISEKPILASDTPKTIITKKNWEFNASPRLNEKNKAYKSFKLNCSIIKWLEKSYSKLFNRQDPKPIKRGLTKDLLTQGPFPYANMHIRQAIRLYVYFIGYHEAVLNETYRYDLEGQPVEFITEKERAYSQSMVENYKQKKEASLAQEKKTEKLI